MRWLWRWWWFLALLLVGLPAGRAWTAPPYHEPAPPPRGGNAAEPVAAADGVSQQETVPPSVCRQVQALRRTALGLVRLNPRAADALAQSLGYSPQAGAGLMCVPLSVYLLQQAGLVPPSVQPGNYWLLNPAHEPDKVRRLFPAGRFVHDLITALPSRLDFRARPLIPGDVLYFYSGSLGTFSHMMVVTYVDRAGRAYGLTNLNTPRGFVVREVMLYDPVRPGVGQLARWNDPRWAWLGLTGFGGLEIWRPARWAPYAEVLGRGACAESTPPALWLWESPMDAQATE